GPDLDRGSRRPDGVGWGIRAADLRDASVGGAGGPRLSVRRAAVSPSLPAASRRGVDGAAVALATAVRAGARSSDLRRSGARGRGRGAADGLGRRGVPRPDLAAGGSAVLDGGARAPSPRGARDALAHGPHARRLRRLAPARLRGPAAALPAARCRF